jgi:hypothetical protein
VDNRKEQVLFGQAIMNSESEEESLGGSIFFLMWLIINKEAAGAQIHKVLQEPQYLDSGSRLGSPLDPGPPLYFLH